MALTPTDVDRIAHLARLALTDDQSKQMLAKLNGFFDLVQAMSDVDTQGVEPLPHPMAAIEDITLRLRDDVVTETNQREANQRSAPSVEDGLYLVPRVIE